MLDTSMINRARHDLSGKKDAWLFGYGSLIHKVDFDCLERRPAYIKGWERRFWQGSHDHRGTPEAPGRVLTLIASPQARCVGMAYRLHPKEFEKIDIRERNGYLRVKTPLWFEDGTQSEGLMYLADETNAAWLGPAPERDIARHIAASAGVSGPNRDYVLALAKALRALGEHDAHVFTIEAELKALIRPVPKRPSFLSHLFRLRRTYSTRECPSIS